MTATPPGNCGIHGYHGRTICPRCSTSALLSNPILSQPEHLTLPGLRAENEQLRADRQQAQQERDEWEAEFTKQAEKNRLLREQRQQAIDALREIVTIRPHPDGYAPDSKRCEVCVARAALVKLGEQEQ